MALTSNIHFGLSAWSAGSFTLGRRCSSGGNAYQCTTAGSSTTAPTGTGSVIPSGTAVFKWLSAIDYTNIQAWYNGLPGTLTQPAITFLWNDANYTTTVGVPFLTMGRVVTSASNNITITTAPGESFVDALAANPALPLYFNAALGVNFTLPAAGAGGINYLTISDANVVISGIQFQDPNPNSGSTILYTSQTCMVQNCIFDGYSQGSGAYMIAPQLAGPSNSVFSFFNNLVVDHASSSIFTGTISGNYNGIYANNTFIALNPSTLLICINDSSAASGVVISQTNNTYIGYTNPDLVTLSQNTGSTINVDHGLFSSTTLTNAQVVLGSGNLFSQLTAGQFVSGTTNFRLVAGSTAINAGATATSRIPAAIDIIGTPRPSGSWSIGAYQFAVPTSTFNGGGHGGGLYLSAAGQAIFNGGGHAGGSFVPFVGNISTFNGGGQGGGLWISNGSVSTFNGGGLGGGIFYDTVGAISASISLNNPGAQVVGVPFLAGGRLTLTPGLQFADDDSLTFTPVPLADVSPIGSGNFTFTHPAVDTAGQHNLLVEDLSTEASAAINYVVLATSGDITTLPTDQTFTPTSLLTIIPAYLYQQYYDDDNLQAFISAYNALAQSYLDWFNGINLPIYTGLSGNLLDWVALGLYGLPRPVLAVVQSGDLTGPFDTYEIDTLEFNESTGNTTSQAFTVTDDIFQRIITWSIYKSDGTAFTVPWLKRRVARFLAGTNGTDYLGPTDQISVSLSGTNVFTITLTSGTIPLTVAAIFQAAVLSKTLPLPFQYTFNVLINTAVPVTPTPPPAGAPLLAFNDQNNSGYLPLIAGF